MTGTGSADPSAGLARVVYRASVAGGREAAIHLVVPVEAATVADAWARFSAIFPDADPFSLEVEVRPFRPLAGGARWTALKRLAVMIGVA